MPPDAHSDNSNVELQDDIDKSKSKDKIEIKKKKAANQIMSTIFGFDLALIGQNNYFDNSFIMSVKFAQIPLHFVLAVKSFIDMYNDDYQNNKKHWTKKLLEGCVHLFLAGISAYQLSIYLSLHQQDYNCNSKENNFIPIGNETYKRSADAIKNPLCFPLDAALASKIGFLVFAAALEIVKIKKIPDANFDGDMKRVDSSFDMSARRAGKKSSANSGNIEDNHEPFDSEKDENQDHELSTNTSIEINEKPSAQESTESSNDNDNEIDRHSNLYMKKVTFSHKTKR